MKTYVPTKACIEMYTAALHIHNCQNLVTTQISCNGWLDKPTLTHPHGGMLLSNTKGTTAHTCDLCESQRHEEIKEMISKRGILYGNRKRTGDRGIRGGDTNTKRWHGGPMGGVKNCSVSWLYLQLQEAIQVLKFIALYNNKQINAIDCIKKKKSSLPSSKPDSGGPRWGLGIWI